MMSPEKQAYYHDMGFSALHIATVERRIEEVRKLVRTRWFRRIPHEVLDAQDKRGETPLHHAVGDGQASIKLVALLLQSGANPNVANKSEGHTPLHVAACFNRTEAARLLLRYGADVRASHAPWRETPLHTAAWKNGCDVAALLLDSGAPIEDVDASGQTPLHYALRKSRLEMINLLLSKGAQASSLDSGGKRPIDYLVKIECGLERWIEIKALFPSAVDPLYQSVLAAVKEHYPDRAEVALIEGLPPLARIALVARVARRLMRLFPARVESARRILETAVEAAERAASGFDLTEAHVDAISHKAICQALDQEKKEGCTIAARAGGVAGLAGKCVWGKELSFGENCLLASMAISSVYAALARSRGVPQSAVQDDIFTQLDAIRDDLVSVLAHAYSHGNGWKDPQLHGPSRDDFGWADMLSMCDAVPGGSTDLRLRWARIHSVLVQKAGAFYPPSIFPELRPTSSNVDA